jgi:excisionase family DNA binding protein
MSNGYTIVQAAQALHRSTKQVRRYIKDGRLPASKVGGEWRIHSLDLGDRTPSARVNAGHQGGHVQGPPPTSPPRDAAISAMERLVEDLRRENLQLAGQLGAATERVRNLEEQVKLLNAPPRPWWRRWWRRHR